MTKFVMVLLAVGLFVGVNTFAQDTFDENDLTSPEAFAGEGTVFAPAPYTLECGSHNYQYRFCQAPTRVRHARIQVMLSHAACDFGRSWGFDHQGVWVDKGCRARFLVTPGH